MKQRIIILMFFLTVSPFASGSENEEFKSFFYKYSLDNEFQKERVKFPLSRFYLDYPPKKNGAPAKDLELMKEKLTKKNWKHLSFYYNTGNQYRSQIFDNFDKSLRDTNQRVFSWLGIENGIKVYYYFQRSKGKWYLVKIEDLSG